MDERIQLGRPVPRPSLDPPARGRVVWPWILLLVIVASLFAVYVWPTRYRWESAGNHLYRVDRFTGIARPVWSGD